ncbi:MAG: flavodoxin domain-containing protein [Rickettsiales bacterium]|nr:flavodoxin domain-containing protein [Rickettsiales bacterium]
MPDNSTPNFSNEQRKLIESLVPSLSKEQSLYLSAFLGGYALSNSAAGEQVVSANAIPLLIIYGSESGNSEGLAAKAAKIAKSRGFKPVVEDMFSLEIPKLTEHKNLLVFLSTWGEGDPPERATEFYKNLLNDNAPNMPKSLNFAVCALGDRSYVKFCGAGKDVDERLEKLGATRVFDRIDCDVDFEKPANEWIEKALTKFLEVNGVDASAKLDVKTTSSEVDFSLLFGAGGKEYSPSEPFIAELSDKVLLSEKGSEKETYHYAISLENSGIKYEVGDALGILPQNNKNLVAETIKTLGFSGEEIVDGKKLSELLTEDYEITSLSAFLIKNYAEIIGDKKLLEKAKKSEISEYIYGRFLIDLIKDYPIKNIKAEDFVKILRKIPPRLYSIASSQKSVGDEVHLTIASVRYNSFGMARSGVSSGFLADSLKKNDKVKIYLKPNKNFRLPQDNDKPIIMVGPGTGIAPFRAFMQERDAIGAKGKNWLFFGEQRYNYDFLYQLDWQDYFQKGLLTNFDAAFSRDGLKKVYVQHKIYARKKEVFDWLESGAYFYVCGDEKRMAKDVDATIHKVISEVSGKGDEFAKEYISNLKKQGRYQRDVY